MEYLFRSGIANGKEKKRAVVRGWGQSGNPNNKIAMKPSFPRRACIMRMVSVVFLRLLCGYDDTDGISLPRVISRQPSSALKEVKRAVLLNAVFTAYTRNHCFRATICATRSKKCYLGVETRSEDVWAAIDSEVSRANEGDRCESVIWWRGRGESSVLHDSHVRNYGSDSAGDRNPVRPGAAGAERNLVQSQAGSPDFRKWESCRTMPLVGGFSRGFPVSPTPSFRRCSIFTSITLIGSRDLGVKSHLNLFTHSPGSSWWRGEQANRSATAVPHIVGVRAWNSLREQVFVFALRDCEWRWRNGTAGEGACGNRRGLGFVSRGSGCRKPPPLGDLDFRLKGCLGGRGGGILSFPLATEVLSASPSHGRKRPRRFNPITLSTHTMNIPGWAVVEHIWKSWAVSYTRVARNTRSRLATDTGLNGQSVRESFLFPGEGGGGGQGEWLRRPANFHIVSRDRVSGRREVLRWTSDRVETNPLPPARSAVFSLDAVKRTSEDIWLARDIEVLRLRVKRDGN
ncbi:hypothetical protein PR048_033398 [Dryococelus australis]|uniref:Uncharacterized protein n=1 Tax=Dryococelus australis TaxID=614101 RepID=A0ABQ9G066_9NEOP|nr:hypothetical protein PR048_033398 [Dryococelus australis]